MTELDRSVDLINVHGENISIPAITAVGSPHPNLFETYTLRRGGIIAKEVRVLITEAFLSDTNASAFFYGKLNESDGRDVALKFSTTGFIDYEYAGLSILHANGVNVPEPIALVERDQQPKIGIIMGRILGNIFSDVSSPTNRFLLGKEVRKANEIAVPGFGLITDGIAQFQSAEEYVRSEIRAIVPHIQSAGAVQLLTDLWNEIRENVAIQQPRFVHRDIKGRNVMVSQSGDVVLFDLEYWNGGDPLWDAGEYLSYILRSGKSQSEFNDFLQGYTNGKEPTDGQKLRILFYTLLSAGRFVELVARVDPANIDYATTGLDTASTFVRGKLK